MICWYILVESELLLQLLLAQKVVMIPDALAENFFGGGLFR